MCEPYKLTKDTNFLMFQCNACRTCWAPFKTYEERQYHWNENLGGYKVNCPGCNKELIITKTLGP